MRLLNALISAMLLQKTLNGSQKWINFRQVAGRRIMNTLIRREVRQWLGLDRQEDRYVQYEHQKCNKNIKHNIKTQHTKHKLEATFHTLDTVTM